VEIETITAPAPDAGGSVGAKSEVKAKPDDSGVQKPAESKEERKFRLKFGKNEREASEAETIALAQKGWASDEKFKSAAQAKREAEEIVDRADVEKLLMKKYGKNKLDWAKEVLTKELQRRAMTPEDLEIEDRKSNLEKLRAEEKEITERRAAEKRDAAQRHYEEQYDRELAAAVEKHKIPKNKYVIGRAIKIATELVNNNLEPDWDLVVQEAKRQWQEEITETLDHEEDFSWMGERARKVSKWLVSKGMGKTQADKEAAKVVKQNDQVPEQEPIDSDTYWAKKREQWSK